MQEQRRYIRYNAEGSAIIKPQDGTSRNIQANLVDISFLGIGVEAGEKISSGTDVGFEVTTKLWDKTIIGKGKIKHVQEIKRYDTDIFRIGIEFIDVDKETIRCIINRIQEDICAQARRKKTF
jgi:c-di-GMP-binding flagellar brake protein YcgR